MNGNGFSKLAKALSKNNQVILYDHRDTGKSTHYVHYGWLDNPAVYLTEVTNFC